MIAEGKILITGGSGMVGVQMPFGIKPRSTELDITDPASIARAFDSYKPSAVMHLAALVDVKTCEGSPEEAKRLNTDGARNMAEAAAKHGIPIVCFSTCLVFDGEKKSPYVESDEPHPLTVYGKTKRAGEEAVLAATPDALIIRTGSLFGGFDRDTKVVKLFINKCKAGEPVSATNDSVSSFTYTPDIIERVRQLLHGGTRGVVHVVNRGKVSRFEIAQEIKRLLNSVSEISPITRNPNEPPRGFMEALTSERGGEMRPYEEALAEYIAGLARSAQL